MAAAAGNRRRDSEARGRQRSRRVIVAVGSDVKGRSVGTPVFGMTDREDSALNGSFSEYALVSAQSTAPKPNNLSYAEAAGLGVVGVTHWHSRSSTGAARESACSITGVAGGVGSTTAQMAVARWRHCKWHRLPRSMRTILQSIGVSQIIDYRQGNIAAQAGAV